MKKIAIALLIIITLSILSFAILDRPLSENQDYQGFSLREYYSFDSAQIYDDDIYYIGKDNLLYKANAIFGEVQFYQDQMKYFAITRDLLIYVDTKDFLHIVMLYQFVDKTMELDIESFEDCIVTNKGIVYKDTDGALCYLKFINWKKYIIVDGKIGEFVPYENEIVFSTDGDSGISLEILSPGDGSVRSIARKQIERFVPMDGYIYYSVGNSIYRVNIESGMSERLVAGGYILDFDVSGGKLLNKSDENLLKLYDLMVGKIREIGGKYLDVFASKEGVFLCRDDSLQNLFIISDESDIMINYEGDTQIMDLGFVGDYIFVQIGEVIDGNLSVDDAIFYSIDGREVYEH